MDDNNEDGPAKEDNATECEPKKAKRKRVKKLCTDIRNQMEFYFSDANLRKDRFLGNLTKESPDGYVELAVFSKFHKISTLTTDMALVAKALSTSTLLEVSEDKQRVKRKTPVVELSSEELDQRIVYVERLPSDVTHDWIKQHFSSCGSVVYVSVPRFKTTGDPKGFAFVEFATKEEADKACEVMNNPPPDASASVGKFPRTNKQMDQLQKQLPDDAQQQELSEEKPEEPPAKKGKKRKHEDETGRADSKKLKADSDTKEAKSHGKEHVPEGKRRKRKRKTSECSTEDLKETAEKNVKSEEPAKSKRRHTDVEQTEKADEGKKKDDKSKELSGKVSEIVSAVVAPESKATKSALRETHKSVEKKESRKRKQVSSEDTEEGECKEIKKVRISDAVQVNITEPVKKKKRRKSNKGKKNKPKDAPQLRVIPKAEWLKLRTEYLKLQKENMRKLKQNLSDLQQSKPPPKKKDHEAESEGENKSKKTLEFVPNVIVKVESDKATTRKALQEALGSAGSIAYIDVEADERTAHVRCADAEGAKSVATAGTEGLTLKLLQGDEEKKYWDKVMADRERKLSKPRNKKRGLTKILEKADKVQWDVSQSKNKHVVFDE